MRIRLARMENLSEGVAMLPVSYLRFNQHLGFAASINVTRLLSVTVNL